MFIILFNFHKETEKLNPAPFYQDETGRHFDFRESEIPIGQ